MIKLGSRGKAALAQMMNSTADNRKPYEMCQW